MSPNAADNRASSFQPDHAFGDQLAIYAYELLRGGAADERYRALADHLAGCAECRARLTELLALTREASDPSLVYAPVPVVRPDLSRVQRPQQLVPEPTLSPFYLADQCGSLWLEFSTRLLRSWLPSSLNGAARGALLYCYEQRPHPQFPDVPTLKVEIFAEPDPALTAICITVDRPDVDALDQSGVPVALHLGADVRRGETDDAGQASFAGIPREALPSVRLEIMLGQ